MYALNSSGPRTDHCGTPVVMVSTSDTLLFMRMPLFKHMTHVPLCSKMSARRGRPQITCI